VVVRSADSGSVGAFPRQSHTESRFPAERISGQETVRFDWDWFIPADPKVCGSKASTGNSQA
jgi:hypothetical protein